MLSIVVAMQAFFLTAKDRFSRENGATAVEYGLLVGLIAVVIVAALLLLGPALANLFTNVTNTIPEG